MKFSSVSIRFYLTGEDTSVNSLVDKIGIQFEKSRFNVWVYSLDIPSTNDFDDIYLAMRNLFNGKEDIIKSITDEKDLFIMVEDNKGYGNFGIDLSLEPLAYFSNLGLALCFDIYPL